MRSDSERMWLALFVTLLFDNPKAEVHFPRPGLRLAAGFELSWRPAVVL